MIKHLRHIKVLYEIPESDIIAGTTWRTIWEDGYCNGECENCKSKFLCFTMGKNEVLVVTDLGEVSVDLIDGKYIN